jgi:hypothetical protein
MIAPRCPATRFAAAIPVMRLSPAVIVAAFGEKNAAVAPPT